MSRRVRLGLLLGLVWLHCHIDAAQPSSETGNGADGSHDTDVAEYRTHFCYNRSFPKVPTTTCSWNYLPRLQKLTVVDNNKTLTHARATSTQQLEHHHIDKASPLSRSSSDNNNNDDDDDDGDDVDERRLNAPEEKIKFVILMQNGRVGSTWLVSLLNTVARHINCQGEFLDANPCKNFEPYGHGKSHKWKKEGIAQ